ncbi:MAG: iron transporter [Hyphomicrobiaceae bacterium]
MKALKLAVLAVIVSSSLAWSQQTPKAKLLSTPEDPTKKTILVGRSEAAGMVIQFELEPATTMIMLVGTPPRPMEHAPAAGEVYHVEVKPIDPRSKTRIPYAHVAFEATNNDTGKSLKGELHPMWGSSGLHYAMNSALLGDGGYTATITIHAPTFGRSSKDKDLFMAPAMAKFHFKLTNRVLIEVSEPSPLPN